jgi:DNA-binding response OmpR family regulator
MNSMAILLVEDNPKDRAQIKECIQEGATGKIDIKEATTLEAALSSFSDDEFDAVLLDLGLPDCSGLDTARRIISKYKETAVIVLPGSGDEELALKALCYGCEDYLEKSLLTPNFLIKAINYAIERKKNIQEKHDILSDLILALERIDKLESLLPICLGCQKIQDEDNHWHDLDEYIRQYAASKIIECICPSCQKDIDENGKKHKTG